MAVIEIKCPECKGTLWLDQATGKVVDHQSADHQKADLGVFLKSQNKVTGFWDDKLKKAKEEEARRKSDLEQRFKQAKEHPEELKGDVESPFKWD